MQINKAQHRDSSIVRSNSTAHDYLDLGIHYFEKGLLSNALEQCTIGIDIHGDRIDSTFVRLLNCVGQVYMESDKPSEAFSYFKRSVVYAEKIGNASLLAKSKSFLGASLEKMGDLDRALIHQNESKDIYLSLSDSTGIAQTLENVGSIYEDKEKYDSARQYFLQAKQYVRDTLSFRYANILNNLGDTYRKQGNISQGLYYTRQALDIGMSIDDLHQIESAYKDLSRAYAQDDDYKNAYKYVLDYIMAKEQFLKENNALKISTLQTQYNMQQKDAEIALLKAKNRVNATRQNLLYTIGTGLLLGILAIFFWLNKRRKDETRLQRYEQEALKIKLDKKMAEEAALQNEIKIKTASLSNYSLHIAQKNKILLELSETLKRMKGREDIDYTKKINGLVKDIDRHLGEEDEWEEFIQLFSEIHPDFTSKVSELTDERLSPAELRLAVLLRLNMSSKEIASILRITPDSVRVARYRLRKKIPIQQGADLVQFMMEL